MDLTAVNAANDLLGHVESSVGQKSNSEKAHGKAGCDAGCSAHPAANGLSKLHLAVLAGGNKQLRQLLRDGADKDVVENGTGRTALHFAALDSNLDAAMALVEAGSNKEARDADGLTPLHLACRVAFRSDPAVALFLIRSGASAFTADAQGITSLHTAVRIGWPVVVRAMLSPQGDARPPTDSSSAGEGSGPGLGYLLHEAVRAGNAEVVAALVDNGWEDVGASERRSTRATVPPSRPPEDKGGKVTVPSATGVDHGTESTGNRLAVQSLQLVSSLETARCQVRCLPSPPLREDEHGGAIPVPVGRKERWADDNASPVMLAADGGRLDVVRALLRGKSRDGTNDTDSRGFTALHLAAIRGSTSIAEALLELGGANRDAATHEGDTALLVAVASGRINVAEALLCAGASVHCANRRGHTALHFAAALGLAAFVKELIDRGADVCAIDGEGAFLESSNSGTRTGAGAVSSNGSCPDGDPPDQENGCRGRRRDAIGGYRTLCLRSKAESGPANSTVNSCTEFSSTGRRDPDGATVVKECRSFGPQKRKTRASFSVSGQHAGLERGAAAKKRRSSSSVVGTQNYSLATGPEQSTPRQRLPTRRNGSTKASVSSIGTSNGIGMLEVGVHLRADGRPDAVDGKDKWAKSSSCSTSARRGVGAGVGINKQALEGNRRKHIRAPPALDRSARRERRNGARGGGGGDGTSANVVHHPSEKQSNSRTPGGEKKSGAGDNVGVEERGTKRPPKKRARGGGGIGDEERVKGGDDGDGCRGDGGGGNGSVSTLNGEAPREYPKRLGRTPLHYAASNGRVETVRVLLEAGAVVTHDGNEQKESPLLVAARGGHAEVVGLLLEQLGLEDVESCTLSGSTPLSVAVEHGYPDVVDELLAKGVSVDRRDAASRQSLLGNAVIANTSLQNRVRLVRSLLRAGADPNGVTACTGGGTAATASEAVATAERMENGTTQVQVTPCPQSCYRQGKEIKRAENPQGGAEIYDSFTPLHHACRVVGGVDVVEVLLGAGADADGLAGREANVSAAGPGVQCPGCSVRPLHIAAAHGNATVVRALTWKGCRLDAETPDPSRSTPLALAVQGGHLEATRALVEAGASIQAVPRREDGTQLAPSLARMAARMKRGDLVSVLTAALVKRDCAESWIIEWASEVNGKSPEQVIGTAGGIGANGSEAGGVETGEDEEQQEAVKNGSLCS